MRESAESAEATVAALRSRVDRAKELLASKQKSIADLQEDVAKLKLEFTLMQESLEAEINKKLTPLAEQLRVKS